MTRNWAERLRSELATRARAYASESGVPYYESLGAEPTILFDAAGDGASHGNFHGDSYRAVAGNAAWHARLKKPHSRRGALPADRSGAAELDSSNSSDALLMNCFCYPNAAETIFHALLPEWPTAAPEFGVGGKVPFADGSFDATEIDMRAGTVLFECKLTEHDFTSMAKEHVHTYRDFGTVFEKALLPQSEKKYDAYQLFRNVLAAVAQDGYFVLICDARRPDLLHSWWQVFGAIQRPDHRRCCRFLLWQEVAASCPKSMQQFLAVKYGL